MKKKSKYMSFLIQKIGLVKSNVKRAALSEYLRSAQRVHTIAFLQWRLKFPSSIRCNEYELEDVIEQRTEELHKNQKNGAKPFFLPKVFDCDAGFYDLFKDVLIPG